jgi:hypothetical protein
VTVSKLCAILRGETVASLDDAERDALFAAARVHRVDRLLAWQTRQIDDGVRATVLLDELDVRELNRVIAALESAGVVPLVLKGAALAHTHYAASWLRPRVDADLMIAMDQRQLATDVLHELGYQRPPFISGELVMSQMPFVRTGDLGREHALDVHWRISNPQRLADLPGYDELAARATTIIVRGQSVRTPCPMDGLLLACVHRAAHHDLSDHLLWIFDIHLLAQWFSEDEWTNFVALASKHEVRALCASGLQSASRCFYTAIPADVIARLAGGSHRPEPSAVYLRKDLTQVHRLLIDLRALQPRARIKLLVEHVIPPAEYVGEKYGVRRKYLLPFFYVRRMVEGVGSWVSGSWVAGSPGGRSG